jgi:hypothetical protein
MSLATTVDDRDQAMINARHAEFLDRPGDEPRVGDIVVFRDGTHRRIAYVWPNGVQTGWDGGTYYLGNGYMSMSGSLHGSVPPASLVNTGRRAHATAWVFHHDIRGAGRGVDFEVTVPVWRCNLDAPR